MNLLDENFPDDQRELLVKFSIPVRQIGRDLGRFGMSDDDIFPLLHRLHRVTFFTHDRDFSGVDVCHESYCVVWLDVTQDCLADYTRRFLRHPDFDTQGKRLGKVARIRSSGITVHEMGRPRPRKIEWTE